MTANRTVNAVCMDTWWGSAYKARREPLVGYVFSLGIAIKLVRGGFSNNMNARAHNLQQANTYKNLNIFG